MFLGAALALAGFAPPAGAATLAAVQERGMIRAAPIRMPFPFSSQETAQPGIQLEIGDAIAKILGSGSCTNGSCTPATRRARTATPSSAA